MKQKLIERSVPPAKIVEVQPAQTITEDIGPQPLAFKAVGMARDKEGWRCISCTIKGDKIVDVKITEPDMRAIALETFGRLAYEEVEYAKEWNL